MQNIFKSQNFDFLSFFYLGNFDFLSLEIFELVYSPTAISRQFRLGTNVSEKSRFYLTSYR